MHIYLKVISVKFHTDLIWSARALGIFEQHCRNNNKNMNENKNNRMSSDMIPISDGKSTKSLQL